MASVELAVVAVVLAVVSAFFDPREFARQHGGVTRLSIATGNTGGVYYRTAADLRRSSANRCHASLSEQGLGLLMQGTAGEIVVAAGTAALGVLALAIGLGGWIRAAASLAERIAAAAAGLLLFYAGTWSDVAGLTLLAVAIVSHVVRVRAGGHVST